MSDQKESGNGFWHRIGGAVKLLTEPFVTVYQNLYTLFLWFLFSIIAGLLGPLLNVIRYCFMDDTDHPILKAIYNDSYYGSFYTFAIVLTASLLGSLLIKWKDDYKQNFRRIKVFAASVSIFLVMIGSVCYCFATLANGDSIAEFKYEKLVTDKPQLVLFLLSIVLAVYCQGVNLMDQNPKAHDKANEDDAIMKDREQGLQKTVQGTVNANQMEGAEI